MQSEYQNKDFCNNCNKACQFRFCSEQCKQQWNNSLNCPLCKKRAGEYSNWKNIRKYTNLLHGQYYHAECLEIIRNYRELDVNYKKQIKELSK